MTKATEQALNVIYKDAKKCPIKGRYYVYDQYRRRLQDLELSNYEYTEACRNLARYLEV